MLWLSSTMRMLPRGARSTASSATTPESGSRVVAPELEGDMFPSFVGQFVRDPCPSTDILSRLLFAVATSRTPRAAWAVKAARWHRSCFLEGARRMPGGIAHVHEVRGSRKRHHDHRDDHH